jgi:hypothetical protein
MGDGKIGRRNERNVGEREKLGEERTKGGEK